MTRGPRAEWTVPASLTDTDDSRLRATLRDELDRILQARASLGEAEPSDRLLRAFLSEKGKVLEAALVRL